MTGSLSQKFRRAKEEKGMVTIEATIALTTFLFSFIMIFSIVSVCRAQARMQIALNNAAQEISQYSYIYGMTGLDTSLEKFQTEANNQKTELNGLVKNTISVFEEIQSLGGDVKSVDISNVDSMLGSWDTISEDLNQTGTDLSTVKEDIEEMAKDPQKLLFGMARLVGSEALEIGKSRLIAEPVARALIKKHLKRSENDTAEAFCASVGIVPGTYFGKESYFNGIDFSNSTLFPYGSEEIKLVATYKVKLIQLVPIDTEFMITQSASTKGWLHGDKTENAAAQKVEELKKKNPNASTWNTQTISQRNKEIRTLELEKLKKDGYVGVSGETYIQAYNESTNTVAMVAMCNPMYGVRTTQEIDRDAVEQDIKRLVSEMRSATDNKVNISVKVKDDKGNITTKKINCSKTPIRQNIVLVVPEDPGVEEYVKGVISDLGYSDMFNVQKGYGTGMKRDPEAEKKEGETEAA